MLLNVDELDQNQQRERLELVVEGTRLGMWDWNPQSGDVIFNDIWAEMLGYHISEIKQSITEWESRVHPADLEGCYKDITAHIEGKTEFYENVHRMKHRDGHWVFILDRGKIVEKDHEGRPIRFTGTHTDITRQKEAEIRALDAMNAKSRFIANMSHEIRTPLNGILGLLQLLSETSLDEQQLEWVNVMMECGDGLLTVINDILDLSKVETGKITVEPRPTDLEKTFHLVFDLFQERAQQKKIDYQLELSASMPAVVVVDDQRIKQIVINLISNAIKFTRKGRVQVRVDTKIQPDEREWLIVEVKDTGKGIENPDCIWDRFSQEDSSISREFGGTGLGLSICKSFASLMNGTIDVESEPGQGSTFTLKVPFVRYIKEACTDTDDVLEEAVIIPVNILVAEDNQVNQMVIRQVLINLGMNPTLVSNGIEAVEACENEAFDIVFMDLHMPKMDGLEAAQLITTRPSVMGSPKIIALTADAMPENRDRFRACGVSDFVFKPFKINEIVDVLVHATRKEVNEPAPC